MFMEEDRTFQGDVDIAVDRVSRILRHKVRLISDKEFVTHIDRMEDHLQNYEEVWLTGHFSNAFNKRVRGLKGKYSGVDFRILAIDPRGNTGNIRALKELNDIGAKVKMHPDLHARMFIGCNKSTDTMSLIPFSLMKFNQRMDFQDRGSLA